MSTNTVTNLRALLRSLDDLPDALNLDQGQLADRLFNELAVRIADRFGSQRGPNNKFQQNRGRYGSKKRRLGIPVGIGMGKGGTRGGDMARLANFLGKRTVSSNEATLAFGITDFDRRKGMWFENGAEEGEDGTERSGADGQPARPFFGMNESDLEVLIDVLADRLVEFFQEF